jgi:adenylate cyclase
MLSAEDSDFSPSRGMVRRLAAILSADVKEYSRLMGEDEEATIHTLTVYQAVIATLVQQHRGRVVDSPGDNVLAEFGSVVEAVQCAVAIQRELNVRNMALPLPRRMQFRLGINLGDVIADGDRIYGDGVNIAARLESLAEGGGICISGTVYDQIATKLALGYEALGEQRVKNIARPVRAYQVRLPSGSVDPPASEQARTSAEGGEPPLAAQEDARCSVPKRFWPRSALAGVGLLLILGGAMTGWQWIFRQSAPTSLVPTAPTLALPDKPSIAVLPFVNMSGDPEQEYFSDGMTEDLITELSRLAGLFVIARNSVYTYKGKAIKPDQVSRELRVRYVMEGSVRRAKDRIRISAQLVDAMTGYLLWVQRYDRDLQDIFAVQEDIARRITQELALRLTPEEKEHMGLKYTNSVEAWDYFSRGRELYRKSTRKDITQARELFEKAISLDPKFAMAYASLAATYRQERWSQDLRPSEQRAFALAQQSVAIDPSLPHGHYQLAYLNLYRRNYDQAIAEIEKAHSLDPNDPDGIAAKAVILAYVGKPDEAIPLMDDAIQRTRTNTPAYYFYHRGLAYYMLKQYKEAKADLQQALISSNQQYRPARGYLVAVLSETDDKPGAKREMEMLLHQESRMATLLTTVGKESEANEEIDRITPYKDSTASDTRVRLRAAWKEAAEQLKQAPR